MSDMPFKSREQETYLRINEPEIHQRWVDNYGHYNESESFSAEKENWPYQDEAKCEIINPMFERDICQNKPTHIIDGWLYSCASCIQNNKWPSDANIQIKRAESFSADFRHHDLPEYEDEDEDGNPVVRKIKRQHSGVGFKNLKMVNEVG